MNANHAPKGESMFSNFNSNSDAHFLAMAQNSINMRNANAGLPAETPAPVQAAYLEAQASAERIHSMAEDLRHRLVSVLGPEMPRVAAESGSRAPEVSASPMVYSFRQLSTVAGNTADILSDILRRLEV